MSVWRSVERALLEIVTARELASLAFISVVFYAFYYPAPYSHQLATDLAVVVVDQDQTAASRRLVRDLNSTQSVHVVGEALDMAHARRIVRSRDAEGVLLLSKGVGDAILAGRGGEGIGLIVEGSYFVRAEGVLGAVSEAVAGRAILIGQELAGKSQLEPGESEAIVAQPLFNGVAGYRDYVFPSIAVVILQQTLLFTAARLVAERRRRGAWVRGLGEGLGIWLACIIVGWMGQAFFFGFAYWLQDVPRGGNTVGLLLGMPIFAAASAAMGLFLGTLFRSGDDALKLLMPTSVPLVFLTGFAWPLNQMPLWLAALAWLSPATAGVHSLVRFNQMGASIEEAIVPLCVMTALMILYLAAWLWRCRVPTGAVQRGA